MKEGLVATLSLNISNIVIDGDNLALINVVRKVWKVPWEIRNIVNDIHANLCRFDAFQVQHCFCEANKIADIMAHRGHTFQNLQYCFPRLILISLFASERMF